MKKSHPPKVDSFNQIMARRKLFYLLKNSPMIKAANHKLHTAERLQVLRSLQDGPIVWLETCHNKEGFYVLRR